MSRFDYVKYDGERTATSLKLKGACMALELIAADIREKAVDALPDQDDEGMSTLDLVMRLGHYEAKAIDALEEFFMYCGKMLRDAQIIANGSAELQEERGNE